MHLAKTYLKMGFVWLLILISTNCFATLSKNLSSEWLLNTPLSTQKISHATWQAFLDSALITDHENINLINYEKLKPQQFELLKKYLQELSLINIGDYNRNEQLAYWINLYNALTVYTVARYYPITNIREIKISPGLFNVGPWEANLITIQGVPLSLDDINNRIIRPIWNDARTLYTLSNATFGAPNLSKTAYLGENINEQLNRAASTYINSLRGAQIIEGQLVVSKLYHWYEDDFGPKKQDIIKHLSQYANEPLKSQLQHIQTIDNYIYNWNLNVPNDNA